MGEEQQSLIIKITSSHPQQSSLVSSFVARGTLVLAEYTTSSSSFSSGSGNNSFKTTALQFLENLPSWATANNNLFTYTQPPHTFVCLLHQGFTFCVISSDPPDGYIPIILAERVNDEFFRRYPAGEKSETAAANSLDQEFGPVLEELMEFCVNNPEEMSKLAEVKAQQHKEMVETLDNILSRSGTHCQLFDVGEDGIPQAQDFRVLSCGTRRKMWLRSMKTKVAILGTFLTLILVLAIHISIWNF